MANRKSSSPAGASEGEGGRRAEAGGGSDSGAAGLTSIALATWRLLRPLVGDRRGSLAVLVTSSVLAGLTESGILAILAQSAAALVDQTTTVHVDIGPLQADESLGALLAVAFGLALMRLGLQAMISIVPAHIAADMQARLRSELFAAYSQASWSEQARDREGHLQELLTSQITSATAVALQAAQLVISLLTFLVLVLSALALSPLVALIVFAVAAGLFAMLRPLSDLGSRRAQVLSRALISYAGGVNEAVRLAEESQVFGAAAAQRERIDQLIADVRVPFLHAQVLLRLVPGIYQSLIYLLVVAALVALYVFGAGHVASLGAVVLLLVRAGSYGQQAQAAFQAVRQTVPYLERVQEAQRRYRSHVLPAGTRPLDAIRTLAFERVSFAYEPGRSVLSEIDFEAAGGEAIGIVGPSGAGKSTLVQILLGLRFPDAGRYLVNGLPADRISPEDWHTKVAYVPQEPQLLHASVADNIRFLRDIDDEAVERAARLAGIHDDVTGWPQGYETIVGPRADAVSGGQQQRICLARAIAARPAILVLDEPTSALDPHSELLIQESLAALSHELTLFVVAHRMSTLKICDRVMVIVAGQLDAFDTAGALQGSNAYYRSAMAHSVGQASA